MRLLIVEDEGAVREILLRMLEPISSRCVTVENWSTAEKILAESQFDIITLDLNLPDIRDQETIEKVKEIKARWPNTLLIVYTGLASPEIEQKVLENGADGFISKGDTKNDGGFLGAFKSVLQKVVKQPQEYKVSVALLEKVIGRINQRYNAKPCTT